MLELALFLGAGWFLGRAFRSWGAPAILAEILVGVVLGPELLNVVPYAKSGQCAADHNPSILVLIGNMGVALMIFESGMHLHFDKVAEVGKDAFIVACIGTLTPIVLGIGTGVALGYNIFPDCLSLGIALAPTSVGIALNLLNDAKFLNSTPGQIIITAAFVDDIFSLVMLVILINVAAGEVTAASVVLPLVLSFAFVGLGVWLAIRVMPQVKVLINRVPENRKLSLQPRDEVHIGLMTAAIVFFGWVGSLIGSHLLGTFVAGLSFANVPRSGLIWSRQVKRILGWMMRLFFSASIGFSIPVGVMFTVEAFWQGLVVTLVPTVIGKLVCGLFLGSPKWLIGWAMVARGEFGFLVLQTAKEAVCESCAVDPATGMKPFMLSDKTYAALVWAMLWSTVLAPLIFNPVLKGFMRRRGALERAKSIGGNLASQAGQRFVMRLVGQHHTGILHEVMDVLHACELDVIEAHAESDDVIDVDRFVVMPRMGGDFDNEKLDEIAHRVKEAINDDESQVIFEPVDMDEIGDLDAVGVLMIRLIGDHHPDVLHEIFDMLAEEKLDVVRAIVDEHHALGDHGGGGAAAKGHGHGHGHGHIHAGVSKSQRKRIKSWRKKKQQKSGSSGSASSDGASSDGGSELGDVEADAAAALAGIDEDGPDAVEAGVAGEGGGGGGIRARSVSWRGTKKRSTSADATAAADAHPVAAKEQRAGLKETETIYAKMQPDGATGRRRPIDAVKRARIRTRITHMLEDHGCHGEAMLRMVSEADAHEAVHPITAIDADDEIAIVSVSGQHHPDVVHEVMDALCALQLDVMHADITQPTDRHGDHSATMRDQSTFYVRNIDPEAAVSATDRARRGVIREKLTVCFTAHNLEGVVSVRPLASHRPAVLSSRRISQEGDALAAAPDGSGDSPGRRTSVIPVELQPVVLDLAARRAEAAAEKPLAAGALEGTLDGKSS